jgi:hypothetical protein
VTSASAFLTPSGIGSPLTRSSNVTHARLAPAPCPPLPTYRAGRSHVISAAILKEQRLAARKTVDPKLAEAERLKRKLARAREKRRPFYLVRDEFLDVCRRKLRDQYGRSAALFESSSPQRIKRTTHVAFAFSDPEAEFALSGRLAILCLLPGVDIGVASAILSLCHPKRYAPLEPRVWWALFAEQSGSFEVADYRRYLARLDELALELKQLDPKGGWSVQLVAYYAGVEDEEHCA